MRDLTKGNEGKQIILFAMPMLVGSIFQQLYNTVDSIIVGRYVGTEAIAAVSGANPIMFLLTSFLTGITLGFSILVSQYYGSQNMKKVKKTIDTTYVFVFIASLVITLLGVVFSKGILHIMNTPEDVIVLCADYLKIVFLGTIASAGYNSVAAILRGLGDSKNPLIFLIIATGLNILLDILFVIKFNMGVKGVALATVIAQGVSFIFSLIYLNKKHQVLKVDVRNLVFDKGIFSKGLKLGVPSAIQQMFFSFGNIALQSLVNSYGTAAMAAFGAGTKIEGFISLPIVNLGAAVSTFVAQNKGAKREDRIRKGVSASIKMAIVLALTVAIVFTVFSEPLISLFDNSEKVVEIGAVYLKTIGPAFIFICISFMWTSAIKGAGGAIFALISSMISLWLGRIPAAYIMADFFGVQGIWCGIPIGWMIGFVVTGIYYKRGNWQNKDLIEEK